MTNTCYSPTEPSWYIEDYIPAPKINLVATKILENAIKAIATIRHLSKRQMLPEYIRPTTVILKTLFSKSGKLNKRIRSIRKDK